jgi:hypothetical protein
MLSLGNTYSEDELRDFDERVKLTRSSPDAFDIAGKTAIYLQVLPDIVEIAKRTAKVFL